MNTVPLHSAITLRSLTKHTSVLINTFTENLTIKSMIALLVYLFIFFRSRSPAPQAPVKFPKQDFSVAVEKRAIASE